LFGEKSFLVRAYSNYGWTKDIGRYILILIP
jgi:hypothetical protein